jgi:hypothetical protein
MIELQRAEIQRLHMLLAEARKPLPPAEWRRRLRRAQSEANRQKHRAELWKHRALLKVRP